MRVSAYFIDDPAGPLDRACHVILRESGGVFIGSGTTLATGERDVEYEISDENKAGQARAALKKAGFRLDPLRAT